MITGSDLKILVGLLSSTLMMFVYKRFCSSTMLGSKGYQYNKHAIEKLSVVKIPAAERWNFTFLVEQILTAKRTNSNADISDLERKIDQEVYSLYDLTDEEIDIVEAADNV